MSPVAHEFPGRPGRNVSSKKSTFKIKRGLLALKLNMEMWRIVIISTFFGIITIGCESGKRYSHSLTES
jgi:hypothetical protein